MLTITLHHGALTLALIGLSVVTYTLLLAQALAIKAMSSTLKTQRTSVTRVPSGLATLRMLVQLLLYAFVFQVSTLLSLALWVSGITALTYDGTTARAYVDGVLVGSATVSATFTHDRVDLGDFAFGGTTVELAQIKTWLGACLTAPELAEEAAFWSPQNAPEDLFAWWQLENLDPYSDSSGNGHTLIQAASEPDSDGLLTVPGSLAPATLDGSVTLVSGSAMQPVAAVTVRGSTTLVTGSQMSFVVNMGVTGAVTLRSESTVSAEGLRKLPAIWRADVEGELVRHSPWISNARPS